ncbi:MAG: hypothetical protein Fur0022_11640 [Anaerolineales bacterium]
MIIDLIDPALFVICIFLAATFLTASFPKLRHPHTFTAAIASYHLLPPHWTRPFARTLPFLELVLGLMLLLGWRTRLAALASVGLLTLFLAAMSINLARGHKDLDCGCSGKGHSQKISWRTITRNVGLVLLALLVAMWGGGFLALDTQSPAVQAFVWEQGMLNTLPPLILSGRGLWLFFQLLRQTVRLMMLTPVESQTVEIFSNFQNLKSVQLEGQE